MITKKADSLYPTVHEQLSAHIPTIECHPNIHFEGYQGNANDTLIHFKCYIKTYNRNHLVHCNIYLEIQPVANEKTLSLIPFHVPIVLYLYHVLLMMKWENLNLLRLHL